MGRREAVTVVRRGRAGGRAARAARGANVQRGQPRGASGRSAVILTCAGRAVGIRAVAGVDAETCPKEAEQEEWRRVPAQ
jgi:hypothetical protein